MSGPNPCPIEWLELIKIIYQKASSEAYSEFLRKPKPDKIDFKKRAVALAHEYASLQEQEITKQNADKGKEFQYCFRLAEGHLEKGEDPEIENIIKQWYDTLP